MDDSTPTPMTGLSLSTLSERSRITANLAEELAFKNPEHSSILFEVSQRASALALRFTDASEASVDDAEDLRSALITELISLENFIDSF